MLENKLRAGQDTDDNIIWQMHITCRITKATNTHSEYVILITFPQQQWLRDRPSIFVVPTLPVLFLELAGEFRTVVLTFRNLASHI